MSLLYIIDGYNITNHPCFLKQRPKQYPDARVALIQLIKTKKLCGSPNNQSCVVFDGYPGYALDNLNAGDIRVIFSGTQSADTRIKKLVESMPNPKNIIVVSDDKEIKSFVWACGAKAYGVEDFLPGQPRPAQMRQEEGKDEISYTQMHKINEELKKLWLS